MTSAGANTWSVPLELNNLESQISGGGGGVQSVSVGNTNLTLSGTAQNPILSGTLVNLTGNVAGNNNYIAGMYAPPFGTSAIVCAGTDTFLIEDTLFTPLLAVSNTGVLLGGAGTLATVPVTAPTVVPPATSDDQVATTAFVQSAILATPPGVGVVSITAGVNIGIDNTIPTVPVVSVLDPLNSQLNIGIQLLTGSSVSGDDNATLLTQCNGGVSSTTTHRYTNTVSQQDGYAEARATNTNAFDIVSWQDGVSGTLTTSINESNASNNTLTVASVDTPNTITATRQDITSTSGLVDTHSLVNVTSGINNTHTQTVNGTGIIDDYSTVGPSNFSSYNETTNTSQVSTTLSNNNGAFGVSAISNSAVLASSTSLLTKTNGANQITTCRLRATAIDSSLKLELTDTTGPSVILNTHTLTASGVSSIYDQAVANILGTTNATTLATSTTDTVLTAGKALTLSATAGNIAVSANQDLLLSSNNCDVDTNKLEMTIATGTTASPMLSLISTSAVAGTTNGTVTIKTNKTGRNAVSGDVVMSQQYNARNFNGVDTTFGKIECSATTATVGDTDGSLDFYSNINGFNQLVFRLNGADNENNSFRPFDLNGTVLKTSTGSMSIDTNVSSTGGAVLTLATKNNVAGSGAGLALTGNTLLNVSAGASAGTHLCLTIGGTVYKIALLNA